MRILAGAFLALAMVSPAGAAPPDVIVGAEYGDPTGRYAHGILGDAVEWGSLRMRVDQCHGCENRAVKTFVARLPEDRVFEDIAPRLVDVDGDHLPEVVVVETHVDKGARLAIYTEAGVLDATPYIGRTHRWLAPVGVGAADLDGDGLIELAYVDRPHLAKTLRVWRFDPSTQTLGHVADYPGVTNHRIGETDIAGGIRDCGIGPEMIVASADWTRVMAVRFDGRGFASRDLGPHEGRTSFAAALACKD